ncbi:MAG: hypothetical protein M1837_000045 [Sclerophora amabilis]|nr:MAG: hypothetical protein M1837_000045 [Sclerophora amabilis]
MQREQRPEGLVITSPPRSRSQSVSSDAPSLGRLPSLLSPPATPSPSPAYIAAAVASRIVTSTCDAHADFWLSEDGLAPTAPTALVAPASLKLINAFLDQLLYNFLHVARSTSLAALRPAVVEILRPTLAREAIAGADQELDQFLGGGEDEELEDNHEGQEPTGYWDLELVWRRTRLLCMVYSSLGDVEEEAEDQYIEQAHLHGQGASAHHPTIVSRAVAIFLTSILEFIGEQTLAVAGQAASTRMRPKRSETSTPDGSQHVEERIVVEELDTEKVALNGTLGRLWRTWRKRVRSPAATSSRALSRDSMFRRASSSGRNSMDPQDHRGFSQDSSRGISLAGVLEEDLAANIPLPMSAHDVDEIEIPGLFDIDDWQIDAIRTRLASAKHRPKSLTIWSHGGDLLDVSMPTPSQSDHGDLITTPRRSLTRTRSQSLPTPAFSPLLIRSEDHADEFDFVTPPESASTASKARVYDTEHEQDQSAEKQSSVVLDQEEAAKSAAGLAAQESSRDVPDASDVDQSQGPDVREDIPPSVPASKVSGGVVAVAATGSDQSSPQADQPPKSDGKPLKLALINDEKPQILDTKRISFEGATRPGTPSRVSVDSARTSATPDSPAHGRSRATSGARSVLFADTPHIQEQAITEEPSQQREDPSTIGLARTSDVSVQQVPTAPSSVYSDDARGEEPGPKAVLQRLSQRPGASASFESTEPAVKPQKSTALQSSDTNIVRSEIRTTTPTREPSSPSSTPGSYRSTTEYGVSPVTSVRVINTVDQPAPSTPSPEPSRSDRNVASGTGRAAVSPETGSSLGNRTVYDQVRQSPKARVGAERISQLPALKTGPPADRAAVQRLYTSPTAPRDSTSGSESRRSESFGKGQRPIHTSGSGTSQVSQKFKGLIGRQHDEVDRLSPTLRSSDDGFGSSSSRDNLSGKATKPSIKEQSFEQLIESDETIQYTLTPRNVREFEKLDAPKSAPVGQRVRTDGHAESINKAPPSAGRSSASKQQSSSNVSPSSGQRSPSSSQASAGKPSAASKGFTKAIAMGTALQSPDRSGQSGSRPSLARDARVEKESTKEIADFLRSTGPGGGSNGLTQTNSARSAPPTQPRNHSGATSHLNGSREGAVRINAGDAYRPESSTSSSTTRTRARLEARTPTIRQGNASSELIDFLRQGPPNDGMQNLRPIRGAAQSRGTPDSRENLPPGDSRNRDRLSPSSMESMRNGSLRSQAQSMTSSHNSQSALLGKQPKSRPDEPPHPKRKQRRVKDPYALDSDDDDEVDEIKVSRRDQESLIDFLRNVPPPQEATAIFAKKPVAAKSSHQKLPSKSSAPSLISRFGRTGSAHSNSKVSSFTKDPPGSRQGSAATIVGRVSNAPPQVSLGSTDHGGSLFSDGGSRTNNTTANGNSSSRSLASRGAHGGPVIENGSSTRPVRVGQVRSARAETGGSNDLAEFLKSSAPPASPNPSNTYSQTSPAKEDGGFTKMFRRKKATGVM